MTAVRLIATCLALLALAVPCPCGTACTLPDVSEQVRAVTGQTPGQDGEQAHSCCPSASDDAPADETEEGCTHCGDGGEFVAPAMPDVPDAVWAQVIPAPAVAPWPTHAAMQASALRDADRARGPPPEASPPPPHTPTFLRLQVIRC